jgi:hypothetical protein
MNTASTRTRTLTFVWMLLHGLLAIPLVNAQDTDRDGLSDAYERGVGRYEVIAGSFTWHQARIDAESRGGHLATIVSSFEWADMKRVLGTAMLGKNLWLGATDELAEGNWRWVTGEPWNFTNWRVNEPGNDSLGNGQGVPEHYLMIWGNETASRDGDQAFWNDATVTGGVLARDGYILERGYWTDMNDPDTDDDGLADSEEVFALPALERITASLSWNEARADAEARGGHLAVITTITEWERLLQVIGTNSPQSKALWLGGNRPHPGGTLALDHRRTIRHHSMGGRLNPTTPGIKTTCSCSAKSGSILSLASRPAMYSSAKASKPPTRTILTVTAMGFAMEMK